MKLSYEGYEIMKLSYEVMTLSYETDCMVPGVLNKTK